MYRKILWPLHKYFDNPHEIDEQASKRQARASDKQEQTTTTTTPSSETWQRKGNTMVCNATRQEKANQHKSQTFMWVHMMCPCLHLQLLIPWNCSTWNTWCYRGVLSHTDLTGSSVTCDVWVSCEEFSSDVFVLALTWPVQVSCALQSYGMRLFFRSVAQSCVCITIAQDIPAPAQYHRDYMSCCL